MTAHSHAIVWLDHRQAKTIFFNARDSSKTTVHAELPASHIHVTAGSASGTHLRGDQAYFAEIAHTLAPAATFLVAGPSWAKDEFAAYLRDREPATAARMAGLEPLDKESDRQLLAFARVYFRSKDRMTPQRLRSH